MIGDNIKQLRERKGLELKDVAEVAGVSVAYISLIENNKRKNPKMDILRKIADVLEVEISDLLDSPDAPFVVKEDVADYTVDELELEFERLKPKMRKLPQEDKEKLIKIVKAYLDK